MANLRLKKTILEVVNNQLKDNNPPVTGEAYKMLLEAGYSKTEAKEKIAAVVLTEIYEVMKENKPYNEERYSEALKEMVQQSIDMEGTYKITTEWDEWNRLVEEGYDCQYSGDKKGMISCWWKAWGILQEILEQTETKISISELEESQEYVYSVEPWLLDMEQVLDFEQEHEKRVQFCEKLLEILDWTYDDAYAFRAAIGEELYAAGKQEEGKSWFENWIKEEPENDEIWTAYSGCIAKTEGTETAYRMIRDKVIGNSCSIENMGLFYLALELAGELKKTEDCSRIKNTLEKFREEMKHTEYDNDLNDDFYLPIQSPVVKEKKIYPNDPCPCGSGKKYKKCCGKN